MSYREQLIFLLTLHPYILGSYWRSGALAYRSGLYSSGWEVETKKYMSVCDTKWQGCFCSPGPPGAPLKPPPYKCYLEGWCARGILKLGINVRHKTNGLIK